MLHPNTCLAADICETNFFWGLGSVMIPESPREEPDGGILCWPTIKGSPWLSFPAHFQDIPKRGGGS